MNETTPTSAPDAITFYWRPGCGFCMGLERKLNTLGVPLDKHNIWDDPDAAAAVRSIARGNETVPTIVIGTAKMVNPSATEVLAAIAENAPEMELTPSSGGGIRKRVFGK